MDISAETKESIQKFILIYTLGYLNAVKAGCVDMDFTYFDEKAGIEFHNSPPYFRIAIISWLEENNFEQNFVDLIQLVIELEDAYSMSKDIFNESLNECFEMAIDELKKIPQRVDEVDKKVYTKVFSFI